MRLTKTPSLHAWSSSSKFIAMKNWPSGYFPPGHSRDREGRQPAHRVRARTSCPPVPGALAARIGRPGACSAGLRALRTHRAFDCRPPAAPKGPGGAAADHSPRHGWLASASLRIIALRRTNVAKRSASQRGAPRFRIGAASASASCTRSCCLPLPASHDAAAGFPSPRRPPEPPAPPSLSPSPCGEFRTIQSGGLQGGGKTSGAPLVRQSGERGRRKPAALGTTAPASCESAAARDARASPMPRREASCRLLPFASPPRLPKCSLGGADAAPPPCATPPPGGGCALRAPLTGQRAPSQRPAGAGGRWLPPRTALASLDTFRSPRPPFRRRPPGAAGFSAARADPRRPTRIPGRGVFRVVPRLRIAAPPRPAQRSASLPQAMAGATPSPGREGSVSGRKAPLAAAPPGGCRPASGSGRPAPGVTPGDQGGSNTGPWAFRLRHPPRSGAGSGGPAPGIAPGGHKREQRRALGLRLRHCPAPAAPRCPLASAHSHKAQTALARRQRGAARPPGRRRAAAGLTGRLPAGRARPPGPAARPALPPASAPGNRPAAAWARAPQ